MLVFFTFIAIKGILSAEDLVTASVEEEVAAGTSRFRRRDHASAILHLGRALKRSPRHFLARLVRSMAYRMTGRKALALRDVRIALRLDSASCAAHLAAAAILADMARSEEAVSECQEAVRLDPRSFEAYELKGDLEFSLCRRALAWKSYETAIRLRPTEPGLRLKAACVLRDLGYFRSGLAQARRAQRLDTSSLRARALCAELDRTAARPPARGLQHPRPYPEVDVDPRLELLSVVLVLAGARQPIAGFRISRASAYIGEILERFKPHRRHPAVKALAQEMGAGLTVIGALRSLLRVSAPPELEPLDGDPGQVQRPHVLELLREFAQDSGFPAFFAEHRDFYRTCREGFLGQMPGRDYAGLMEEYSGLTTTARYTLHLAPMMPPGPVCRLNHLHWDSSTMAYHIHTMVPPSSFERGLPLFNYEDLRWSIWHELGHALLDHLLEGHAAAVEKTETVLGPAAAGHYGSWAQSLREHIVQGLACRMTDWSRETGKDRRGPPAPRPDGLPFLRMVMERLRDYERGKRRYRDLSRFYPRLIDGFVALARRTGAKHAPAGPPASPPARDAIL